MLGTFWEIRRMQIQIYPQTSIEPKYVAFYVKNVVRVPLQSLLVQLSWRVAFPYNSVCRTIPGYARLLISVFRINVCKTKSVNQTASLSSVSEMLILITVNCVRTGSPWSVISVRPHYYYYCRHPTLVRFEDWDVWKSLHCLIYKSCLELTKIAVTFEPITKCLYCLLCNMKCSKK